MLTKMFNNVMKCKRICRFGFMFNHFETYSQYENPYKKTWKVISNDLPDLFDSNKKKVLYPEHADIVIIGGGFIGSSVAYWLKTKAGEGLSVVVLEKDPTYKDVPKNISLGTIIQHYSLPENMHLSNFGAEFLRNIKTNLNNDIDIQYCPHGHLVLASEKYASRLEENVAIQRENGIRSQLLTVNDIKKRYPWINTQDIYLGCIGTESEGTFNSWTFLQGLVKRCQDMGTMYVNAEVVGFEMEKQRDVLMEGVAPGSFKKINRVVYRTTDNEEHSIKFAGCILTAGHLSGEVAKLVKVGTGDGLLEMPLPIKARENKVYSIKNIGKSTGLDTPLITDTSGMWLRRIGVDNNLLCGHVPLLASVIRDPLGNEYLEKVIKPPLHSRILNSECAELKSFTTELYDYNEYDENGIIGPHPYHNNLYIVAGFGKNGCVFAPGLGRAISELIIDSNYNTIDLTRFTFDRILTGNPMIEFNIY